MHFLRKIGKMWGWKSSSRGGVGLVCSAAEAFSLSACCLLYHLGEEDEVPSLGHGQLQPSRLPALCPAPHCAGPGASAALGLQRGKGQGFLSRVSQLLSEHLAFLFGGAGCHWDLCKVPKSSRTLQGRAFAGCWGLIWLSAVPWGRPRFYPSVAAGRSAWGRALLLARLPHSPCPFGTGTAAPHPHHPAAAVPGPLRRGAAGPSLRPAARPALGLRRRPSPAPRPQEGPGPSEPAAAAAAPRAVRRGGPAGHPGAEGGVAGGHGPGGGRCGGAGAGAGSAERAPR